MHIRIFALILIVALAALTGCATPSNTGFGPVANEPHAHDHAETGNDQHSAPATAESSLTPVLATSEIVVGPNRIAIGLLEDNAPIKDAAQTNMQVRYYKLNGNEATLVGEETARYYGEGLGDRGTFIVKPTFDTPGTWGMEVAATRPGQEPVTQRMSLDVKAESSAPVVGAPAPQSDTPTSDDVSDLRQISSDANPNPRLHQMSVKDAVTSGKPSLILFATPGYCQTAVCGPGVDVVQTLADRFGDQLNAVHVEVYQLPYDNGKVVPAMQEWGLQTEPWLFLVDREGKIAARYEGGITVTEIEPDVAKLVN